MDEETTNDLPLRQTSRIHVTNIFNPKNNFWKKSFRNPRAPVSPDPKTLQKKQRSMISSIVGTMMTLGKSRKKRRAAGRGSSCCGC